MIPNGKEITWNEHHLVFESEPGECRGCFFADKDSCPDCDNGIWVEENIEASKRRMTENLKRFRIEFTVDVHHEGVTKDWDWSNEEIKHSAIQELTCMVPYPEDITFSEVDDPWHREIPTEEGWYVFQFHDSSETWLSLEYLTVPTIAKMNEKKLFNSPWQKIELCKK